MPEDTTPTPDAGEQQPDAAATPPAQDPVQPAAGQSETVDWEARYKGVMTVLNQKNAEL